MWVKINNGNGSTGSPGAKGDDGKSAYEVWLELGNTGTEQDFIDSLRSKASKWSNKKVNWLGDSITRGWGTDKTYHQILNERIGFAESRGYGIDGSTIADGLQPFHERVASISDDADLIGVFGGTNDWGNLDRELGESFVVDGKTKIPNTDTNTFYGGVHKLCQNLLDKFPTKKIFFITPIHRVGEHISNESDYFLEDYVNAVIEVCNWYSIPILNLWAEGSIQPNDSNQMSAYFTGNDGTHPNYEGHRVIADKIEEFINKL